MAVGAEHVAPEFRQDRNIPQARGDKNICERFLHSGTYSHNIHFSLFGPVGDADSARKIDKGKAGTRFFCQLPH